MPFKMNLWKSDLERILSREWPSMSPVLIKTLQQSEDGRSFTLVFDSPAFPKTEDDQTMDASDALFNMARRTP